MVSKTQFEFPDVSYITNYLVTNHVNVPAASLTAAKQRSHLPFELKNVLFLC